MDDPNTNLSTARRWVERIVVGLNLCPFAEAPMLAGRVRFVESQADDLEALLHELIEEIERLDHGQPDADTTLIVIPTLLGNFDDFLDAVGMAEALLEQTGHEGSYQIAHFHPDYVFADTQPDDAANLTNRSPHPMIHIIRWEDVRKAMTTHPDVTAIPKDNQDLLRQMGHEAVARLLDTE